jgi:hypothetical protein
MALAYERRHLVDTLYYHKRQIDGSGEGATAFDCLLLESDTGTLTDDLLLEDSSLGCLLLGAEAPPPGDFLLLENDAGSGDSIVLLQEGAPSGVLLQSS